MELYHQGQNNEILTDITDDTLFNTSARKGFYSANILCCSLRRIRIVLLSKLFSRSNENGILREYQAYDLVEFILRCVQMMLFVSYRKSLLYGIFRLMYFSTSLI